MNKHWISILKQISYGQGDYVENSYNK